MPQLIYPEYSKDKEEDPNESLSDRITTDPTPEPGPPSEKSTEEPISEPDSDTLSHPYVPTREISMRHLSPGDIVRYQKGSDPPIFSTLEERTKEDPWGDTSKIRNVSQHESL